MKLNNVRQDPSDISIDELKVQSARAESSPGRSKAVYHAGAVTSFAVGISTPRHSELSTLFDI